MMKEIVSVCVMCFMMIPALAWAEEGFKVAGQMTFKKTGNLYMRLATKEEFEEDKESQFRMIIEIGEEEQNAKTALFAFENIPAGRYAIMVFQDVNGNGELDRGTFGPKEPWGNYRAKRPKFRGPKFKEMAFEVKEDITDIRIETK